MWSDVVDDTRVFDNGEIRYVDTKSSTSRHMERSKSVSKGILKV